MNEKMCKQCGELFTPTHTLGLYCSKKCKLKSNYQTYYAKIKSDPQLLAKFKEYQRNWIAKNREKVNERARRYRKLNPQKISEHIPVISRYIKHRQFIFNKFGNRNKGINRFYQIEAYEQRLQEMDALFINTIPQTFPTQNLETIINLLQKKISEQDKIFKLQSINLKGDKKWNKY
jgi:hypothetical protein